MLIVYKADEKSVICELCQYIAEFYFIKQEIVLHTFYTFTLSYNMQHCAFQQYFFIYFILFFLNIKVGMKWNLILKAGNKYRYQQHLYLKV